MTTPAPHAQRRLFAALLGLTIIRDLLSIHVPLTLFPKAGDFVMPWFLFMVGTSISISLRKYRAARRAGTYAVALRAAKLFGLGMLLQGGGFPSNYHYGFNLAGIPANGTTGS